MYNVSNGTLKVGQAVQYKACALSSKTAEIFRIGGRGGGSRQVEWSPHTLTQRFLGLQMSDFLMFIILYIIRFVFPLAFQCRIRNCSTAKTREDIAKRKRKVENGGSAFLHFLDSFKHISRFLGL